MLIFLKDRKDSAMNLLKAELLKERINEKYRPELTRLYFIYGVYDL